MAGLPNFDDAGVNDRVKESFEEDTGVTSRQKVTLATSLDPSNDEVATLVKGKVNRITTATTTACEAGACVVVSLIVKATLTGTVTIQDNSATVDIFPIGLVVGTYELGYLNATDCDVITSAGDDITVVTRAI